MTETTKTGVSMSIASYIADDIEALATFYAEVFELAEVMELRSDIFRGLDVDGVTLGFSATVVYEMLSIDKWAEASGTRQYLTFEVATDEEVSTRTATAVALGATLQHEPYETYYGAFQSVLADPEGNVFRINHFR
ncbi:MAG: VOC family protein [Actinomycetota bacterium]